MKEFLTGSRGETIAETFDIYIYPPSTRYREVLEAVYTRLLDDGWKHSRTLYYEDEKLIESTKNNSMHLLNGHPAMASLQKDRSRWIDLAGGFNRPDRIELGSDILFFERVNSLEEFKHLFSEIRWLKDTIIIGDVESRLDRNASSIKSYRRAFSFMKSNRRLESFGFFWIDQLEPGSWRALCMVRPDIEKRELALIGETHLVMMWDTPYQWKEASAGMLPLAKEIAGLTH